MPATSHADLAARSVKLLDRAELSAVQVQACCVSSLMYHIAFLGFQLLCVTACMVQCRGSMHAPVRTATIIARPASRLLLSMAVRSIAVKVSQLQPNTGELVKLSTPLANALTRQVTTGTSRQLCTVNVSNLTISTMHQQTHNPVPAQDACQALQPHRCSTSVHHFVTIMSPGWTGAAAPGAAGPAAAQSAPPSPPSPRAPAQQHTE